MTGEFSSEGDFVRSCKRRGFCPSCLGRRMSDLAAHLVDEVSPEVWLADRLQNVSKTEAQTRGRTGNGTAPQPHVDSMSTSSPATCHRVVGAPVHTREVCGGWSRTSVLEDLESRASATVLPRAASLSAGRSSSQLTSTKVPRLVAVEEVRRPSRRCSRPRAQLSPRRDRFRSTFGSAVRAQRTPTSARRVEGSVDSQLLLRRSSADSLKAEPPRTNAAS